MRKNKEDNGCLGWIGAIVFLCLASYFCGGGASGPEYPNDPQGFSGEYADEMSEIDPRAENYDPGGDYQPEPDDYYDVPSEEELNSMGFSYNDSASTCSNGCTSHVSGCDIKGNVSFDASEKIYHVPGQKYYSQTKIDPAYGERWFCTEAEARANGWRKSYE